MAGLNRESIYAALLTRLQGVQSLKSVSRRLPPEKLGAVEQPAAFLPAGKEIPQYNAPTPLRWTLHPMILVYATTDDEDLSPSAQLAPLIKDIEAALQWKAGETPPAPGGPTTLGNTCVHCIISEVEYVEDTAGGQGVVFMPLEILAVNQT
jgi:hypothetical protein